MTDIGWKWKEQEKYFMQMVTKERKGCHIFNRKKTNFNSKFLTEKDIM
jgi:hypothetical protein